MKDESFRQHITVRAIPAVKVDTRCPTQPEPIYPTEIAPYEDTEPTQETDHEQV